MRGLLVTAFLATALLLTSRAEAGLWTAACQGQQIQYQQITDGDGYLHAARGDGTFTTVRLKQSFLDAKMVCGSVPANVAPDEFAAVCANTVDQTIRVLTGDQRAKGVKPEKAPVFCPAVVTVN